MTKKEIVKTISDEIGLTQLKTKEIVQKTFDAIVETLGAQRGMLYFCLLLARLEARGEIGRASDVARW